MQLVGVKKKSSHKSSQRFTKSGVLNFIHEGPKEDQNYILEGQMNTTFWAFPKYFCVL